MTTAAKPSSKFRRASDAVLANLQAGNFDALPRVVLNRMPTWLELSRSGTTTRIDGNLNRDLDRECGYVRHPTVEQYRQFYDRVSLAHRVVNIWPDECWAAYPKLTEDADPKVTTGFEEAWQSLVERLNPWHFLHRADRLSRIGYFGCLLLGFKGDPESPAYTVNVDGTPRANTQKQDLLYLRAFPQGTINTQGARVLEWEEDTSNPRFGQPDVYEIDVGDYAAGDDGVLGPLTRKVRFHWTRVVHLADNREASEVYGVPALRPVLNDVQDIRKVSGASAEMFYKAGFPGYQYVVNPNLTGADVDVDTDDVKDELAGYMDGLQRYLSAVSGEWKALTAEVADPSKNLESKFQVISATIGVPVRILMGSEAGHLASTQDAGTWKERLRGRQLVYLEPMVVRPFVNRLLDAGVLPRPKKYSITWRDLQTLGDKDRAEVFLKQVQGLMQYVTGEVCNVVPLRTLFTLFMGITDDQADAIVQELGGDAAVRKALEDLSVKQTAGRVAAAGAEDTLAPPVTKPAAAPQGGGRTGNPGASPGRPAGAGPGKP